MLLGCSPPRSRKWKTSRAVGTRRTGDHRAHRSVVGRHGSCPWPGPVCGVVGVDRSAANMVAQRLGRVSRILRSGLATASAGRGHRIDDQLARQIPARPPRRCAAPTPARQLPAAPRSRRAPCVFQVGGSAGRTAATLRVLPELFVFQLLDSVAGVRPAPREISAALVDPARSAAADLPQLIDFKLLQPADTETTPSVPWFPAI